MYKHVQYVTDFQVVVSVARTPFPLSFVTWAMLSLDATVLPRRGVIIGPHHFCWLEGKQVLLHGYSTHEGEGSQCVTLDLELLELGRVIKVDASLYGSWNRIHRPRGNGWKWAYGGRWERRSKHGLETWEAPV